MNPSDSARRKLAAAPADLRLAALFSPPEQREALAALFAVYLEIREVLHECSDSGIARMKLGWWQEEISLLLDHKPRHPLSQNLARFTEKRVLPPRPFIEIVEGVRTEVDTPSFPHFGDVERYCYRRGGALIELSALLAGAQHSVTLDAARALGIGWQLADIVIQTTMHARHGRIYFAAEDLRKHGVDRHVAGDVHTDSGLKALLADYAQRARAFRDSAMANPLTERRSLVCGWILSGLARARLKKFARQDYNTDTAPVELRPPTALITAWQSARETCR